MKHHILFLFTGAFVTLGSIAQPISIKDELMYPVNPPKKVFPAKPPTSNIRLIQSPSAFPETDPASRKYIDSLKVWMAAKALIRDGKNLEAISIMETAKERLEEIQKNYPDFEPLQVKKLTLKISESIDTNKKAAEQGAAANP